MALKLALSCGDTNSLITAVETLGDRVDPELANTLAAHLRRTNHHSHAAALLATAGKVKFCYSRKILDRTEFWSQHLIYKKYIGVLENEV